MNPFNSNFQTNRNNTFPMFPLNAVNNSNLNNAVNNANLNNIGQSQSNELIPTFPVQIVNSNINFIVNQAAMPIFQPFYPNSSNIQENYAICLDYLFKQLEAKGYSRNNPIEHMLNQCCQYVCPQQYGFQMIRKILEDLYNNINTFNNFTFLEKIIPSSKNNHIKIAETNNSLVSLLLIYFHTDQLEKVSFLISYCPDFDREFNLKLKLGNLETDQIIFTGNFLTLLLAFSNNQLIEELQYRLDILGKNPYKMPFINDDQKKYIYYNKGFLLFKFSNLFNNPKNCFIHISEIFAEQHRIDILGKIMNLTIDEMITIFANTSQNEQSYQALLCLSPLKCIYNSQFLESYRRYVKTDSLNIKPILNDDPQTIINKILSNPYLYNSSKIGGLFYRLLAEEAKSHLRNDFLIKLLPFFRSIDSVDFGDALALTDHSFVYKIHQMNVQNSQLFSEILSFIDNVGFHQRVELCNILQDFLKSLNIEGEIGTESNFSLEKYLNDSSFKPNPNHVLNYFLSHAYSNKECIGYPLDSLMEHIRMEFNRKFLKFCDKNYMFDEAPLVSQLTSEDIFKTISLGIPVSKKEKEFYDFLFKRLSLDINDRKSFDLEKNEQLKKLLEELHRLFKRTEHSWVFLYEDSGECPFIKEIVCDYFFSQPNQTQPNSDGYSPQVATFFLRLRLQKGKITNSNSFEKLLHPNGQIPVALCDKAQFYDFMRKFLDNLVKLINEIPKESQTKLIEPSYFPSDFDFKPLPIPEELIQPLMGAESQMEEHPFELKNRSSLEIIPIDQIDQKDMKLAQRMYQKLFTDFKNLLQTPDAENRTVQQKLLVYLNQNRGCFKFDLEEIDPEISKAFINLFNTFILSGICKQTKISIVQDFIRFFHITSSVKTINEEDLTSKIAQMNPSVIADEQLPYEISSELVPVFFDIKMKEFEAHIKNIFETLPFYFEGMEEVPAFMLQPQDQECRVVLLNAVFNSKHELEKFSVDKNKIAQKELETLIKRDSIPINHHECVLTNREIEKFEQEVKQTSPKILLFHRKGLNIQTGDMQSNVNREHADATTQFQTHLLRRSMNDYGVITNPSIQIRTCQNALTPIEDHAHLAGGNTLVSSSNFWETFSSHELEKMARKIIRNTERHAIDSVPLEYPVLGALKDIKHTLKIPLLNPKLKVYQQEMVEWLEKMFQAKISPVLSAEMGCGKTPTLASKIIYNLLYIDRIGINLIVCPKSTVKQTSIDLYKHLNHAKIYAWKLLISNAKNEERIAIEENFHNEYLRIKNFKLEKSPAGLQIRNLLLKEMEDLKQEIDEENIQNLPFPEGIQKSNLWRIANYQIPFEHLSCVNKRALGKAVNHLNSIDSPILITSFESIEELKKNFETPKMFHTIVIDEAQKVHSNESIKTNLLREVIDKIKPVEVIKSTGSPFENNVLELFTELEIGNSNRKYFLDATREKLVNKFVNASTKLKNQERGWEGRFLDYFAHYEVFSQIVRQLVYSIKMDDPRIADAWGKENVPVPSYRTVDLNSVLKHEKIAKSLSEVEGLKNNKLTYLKTLSKLLIHPDLIGQRIENDSDEVKEFIHKIEKMGDKELDQFIHESPIIHSLFQDDKFLSQLNKGAKSLTFVHNLVLGQIIELILKMKYPHVKVLNYHGNLNELQRQKVLDEFKAVDPQQQHTRFLILSVQAGGVGLNLPEAQTVTYLGMSYNPQERAQAIRRALRIGHGGERTVIDINSDLIFLFQHLKTVVNKKGSFDTAFFTQTDNLKERLKLWMETIKMEICHQTLNESNSLEEWRERTKKIEESLSSFYERITEEELKELLQKVQPLVPERIIKEESINPAEFFEDMPIVHFNTETQKPILKRKVEETSQNLAIQEIAPRALSKSAEKPQNELPKAKDVEPAEIAYKRRKVENELITQVKRVDKKIVLDAAKLSITTVPLPIENRGFEQAVKSGISIWKNNKEFSIPIKEILGILQKNQGYRQLVRENTLANHSEESAQKLAQFIKELKAKSEEIGSDEMDNYKIEIFETAGNEIVLKSIIDKPNYQKKIGLLQSIRNHKIHFDLLHIVPKET